MSPSEIFLPRAIPYPIKVLSFNVQPHQPVQRQAALLNYSFAFQPSATAPFETRIGTWESHVEGVLKQWLVTPGQVIIRADRPVVLIEEPCKHPVQSFGLCGLCGKDMTEMDYTGFADADRASIQMDYSAIGPTLSLEEATRIERETSERLLKSRKLHLIVDLDQTIVHATVDPTVGEWMVEGEPNANWEALKDVRKFQLVDLPTAEAHEPADNCWYYIKPRPGLDAFLTDLAEKYEMHVYTMGTRAYADRVCKAIDPSGKLFAGRILSRDESGSIAKKRLQRLFPSDQSMVVIIDDRADVWDWCPNLVKVVPFEFFVGIGDINSAFLPKVEPLVADAAVRPSKPRVPSAAKLSASTTTTPSDEDDEDDNEDPGEAAALLTKQSRELEAQLEDRPLAKKQEELTHAINEVPEKPVNGQPQQPLLTNSDQELERVKNILDYVHRQFFRLHDASLSAAVMEKKILQNNQPNVMSIIPKRMAETFKGKNLVFSSVIPLGTNPEHSDIWRMARSFGAVCHAEVTSKVTHVVAAKRGTVKVDEAYAHPHIAVVWLKWFSDSVAQWECLPETDYLLDPHASTSSFNGIQPIKQAGTEQQSQIAVDVEEKRTRPEKEAGKLQVDIQGSTADMQEISPTSLLNVSWTEMDKEVDEYLAMDSDEEEEEATLPTPPRASLKRVRSRSGTPSIDRSRDDDLTRSPLAKRKKLAADRPPSMLKKEILSNDAPSGTVAARVSPGSVESSSQSDPDDNTTDKNGPTTNPASEIDDEDDFLLRDLEEDETGWG